MPTIDPQAKKKIDAYIAKQPAWAKAMLVHLRKLIHQAVPEITEDWKWGPNFNHNGMVANIGGFKAWVALVIFKGALIKDNQHLFNSSLTGSGLRTTKFYRPEEIKRQEQTIIDYIRQAVQLNVQGVKIAPKKRAGKQMPAAIKQALMKRDVLKVYQARPPYQQRDYVHWITTAKQPATQSKRLDQMLEELEDGNRYMGIKWGRSGSGRK